MRGREDQAVKNGRWYIVRGGTLTKVGWGDVSFNDLHHVAATLQHDRAFVVLPEHPPGGQHLPSHVADHDDGWSWYDRADHTPPTIEALVDAAWFVIVDSELVFVDHHAEANRAGTVWLRRGRRIRRDGTVVPTAKVRVKAIRPSALAQRLREVRTS